MAELESQAQGGSRVLAMKPTMRSYNRDTDTQISFAQREEQEQAKLDEREKQLDEWEQEIAARQKALEKQRQEVAVEEEKLRESLRKLRVLVRERLSELQKA